MIESPCLAAALCDLRIRAAPRCAVASVPPAGCTACPTWPARPPQPSAPAPGGCPSRERLSVDRHRPRLDGPCSACALATLLLPAARSAQRCAPAPTTCSVDLSSTFYALNPSGDLATTQATFQDWFRGMKGWEVSARWPPLACAPAPLLSPARLPQHAIGALVNQQLCALNPGIESGLSSCSPPACCSRRCRARRGARPQPRSWQRRCSATPSSCTAGTAAGSSTSQVRIASCSAVLSKCWGGKQDVGRVFGACAHPAALSPRLRVEACARLAPPRLPCSHQAAQPGALLRGAADGLQQRAAAGAAALRAGRGSAGLPAGRWVLAQGHASAQHVQVGMSACSPATAPATHPTTPSFAIS